MAKTVLIEMFAIASGVFFGGAVCLVAESTDKAIGIGLTVGGCVIGAGAIAFVWNK